MAELLEKPLVKDEHVAACTEAEIEEAASENNTCFLQNHWEELFPDHNPDPGPGCLEAVAVHGMLREVQSRLA